MKNCDRFMPTRMDRRNSLLPMPKTRLALKVQQVQLAQQDQLVHKALKVQQEQLVQLVFKVFKVHQE